MATMNMQGLLRLAGWGSAAAGALLFAVIAAMAGSGQQRLVAEAQARRAAEMAEATAANAQQLARLVANENDTRLLIEMVRSLSTDREFLMNRVAVLERNLEDVTGSIRAPAVVAPAAGPAEPPVETPPKDVTPVQAVVPPAIPAEPPATPPPAEPPKRVVSVVPTSVAPAPDQPRPAAGVEIGGAANFDGLRSLWGTLNAGHPGLFEGLQPIVMVRENAKTRAADLRLVAGPLTDVEYAARICATLSAAMRSCRLVAYEGQPLSLAVAEPPRRPATPAPRPTPPRPGP